MGALYRDVAAPTQARDLGRRPAEPVSRGTRSDHHRDDPAGHYACTGPAALARGAIDAAEQDVRADAARIGTTVTAAVKASYTTSITRIYLFAIPLSAVALLVIALWLREIPSSKGRTIEATPGE